MPDPDSPAPSPPGEIVTLVMDGGTAYVLVSILGLTIDNFAALPDPRPGALPAAEVLIHAHDELAGQLSMPAYADRTAPGA